MLPRRETRWNLQGCPKLANRSQPLIVRSSPYYQDMWRRYYYLTSFLPIVNTRLSSEDIADKLARWCIAGHKVNFARGKIPSGDKSCRKCTYSIPGQDMAEHSANFGRLLLSYVAATKPKHENHWNLLECPKLANRSQPLIGWSSEYSEDIWTTYCHSTSFSDCRYMP